MLSCSSYFFSFVLGQVVVGILLSGLFFALRMVGSNAESGRYVSATSRERVTLAVLIII